MVLVVRAAQEKVEDLISTIEEGEQPLIYTYHRKL
jgi:hypothetical protein